MVPKSAQQWLYFAGAVFVAGIIIQTIVRRVPALQQIGTGF